VLQPMSVWLGELATGRLRLTAFEPVRGNPTAYPELPAPPSQESWDLSPDGTAIVSLDGARAPVRLVLLDLRSRQVSYLESDAWRGAESAAWSADGRGWIVTRGVGERGGEVLYVDRQGHSKVLWTSTFQRLVRPTVSPDGRRIAFRSAMLESCSVQ